MMEKINKAGSATSDVQAQVRQALSALDGSNGGGVNGFGVYADVSLQRSKLHEARSHIDAALKIMSDTSWPTNADYDTV